MQRVSRLTLRSGVWLLAAGVALGLAGCSAPATTTASRPPAAAAATAGVAEAPGAVGEAVNGDEPTVTYSDATNHFRLDHPRSWGTSSPAGEVVRFTGRDEFISVAIVSTTQAPLEYATADVPQLTAASPGYKSAGPKTYTVAGASGAMVAYTWQAGPSPVTGKQVPSSANRYYIPGPAGKLAVFTYSSPTPNYDPAGADDFANAYRWLP